MSALGFWTIKRKLIVFTVVLFAIPVVSLSFLRQMESVLVDNLRESLANYANMVSYIIASGDLKNTSFIENQTPAVGTNKIYVPIAHQEITIDGYADDWVAQRGFEKYFSFVKSKDSFSVQTASNGKDFYLLVEVVDNEVRYRESVEQLDNSDQVLIVLKNAQGQQVSLRFAPVAVGRVRPTTEQNQIENFWLSQSSWQETAKGYTLELKLSARFNWRKLGLKVVDFDSTVNNISTAQSYESELSDLLWPDQLVQSQLDKLDIPPGKRVWVVDRYGQVRARSGTLNTQLNIQPINPLIHFFLAPPGEELVDARAKAIEFDTPLLKKALTGEPSSMLEVFTDNKTAIAMAVHPIVFDNTIVGATLIEQTVASVQVLQREAMNIYVNTVLLVMLIVIVVLMVLAIRFTSRVSRLNGQALEAVDDYGRVKKLIKPDGKRDELGQLSNSFSSMTGRLSDYNEYLEKLASRLTHEIRTPLAIVRTSLDNLSLQNDLSDEPLLKHAQQGVDRLSQLISRMREAARVEQSILNVELQEIDLIAFIRNYYAASQAMHAENIMSIKVNGIQISNASKYDEQQFEENRYPKVRSSEELLAQLLDKLISNAVDFAETGSEIEVITEFNDSHVSVAVANIGPPLPEISEQELFALMTSEREESFRSDSQSHLGLGLYIVRLIAEHHGATYFARNWRSDSEISGVIIGVNLPRKRPKHR